MQTVLDILNKAGGWHPGLSLKIETSPICPLSSRQWTNQAHAVSPWRAS